MQIFKTDMEKFECYDKSVFQGLGFDILMRVVHQIFKYDNKKPIKEDQEIQIKLAG